jgi:hypothetical protein
MARSNIAEEDSSYYPPRARWYSPVFYLGNAIRRWFWLDRIHIQLPQGITFSGSVAGFLVPGLGIYLRGRKFWGWAALGGYALLQLLFLVGFGYPIGNFAFGLLMAVHATGFVYYCSPLLRQEELGGRLGITLLAALAIGLLIYLPIRNLVLQRWLVPIRLASGQVYVMQRQFPAAAVRRGDWIAYKIGSDSSSWDGGGGHGTIYVRAGVGFGPVLAMAGERVMFSTNGFTVNTIQHPLLPHMPQSGEVAVAENHWFIWPSYSISGAGNENRIASAMMELAMVPEKQFVGKPFKRWFGRKQILP